MPAQSLPIYQTIDRPQKFRNSDARQRGYLVIRYVYTVWFRDRTMLPSDEDYEWVACILVDAESSEKAREWGDHLALSFASRNPRNSMLRSEEVTPVTDPIWKNVKFSDSPVVTYGADATDEYIGW